MLLTGSNLKAAREFLTMVSGDKQEFKRLLARAQDNPQELLSLINQNVTRTQAERSKYVSYVVAALEANGYGDKIRFKDETLEVSEKAIAKQKAVEEVRKAPYFDLLERMGIAGKFIGYAAANA